MQQNDVRTVHAIRLENSGSGDLLDLEVRLWADPVVCEPWAARIARVGAGASFDLLDVEVRPLLRQLADTTERLTCVLRAEVLQGGVAIADASVPLTVLAPDEWPGLSVLPEIGAAFVTPNHPAIAAILRAAADHLAGWTGDPSLSGYQSRDRKRAFTTAAAIYAAIRELGVTYVNPPASFELEGQRVRLPGAIAEHRLATCLDMAFLSAGALEAAGLNALLVIVHGHAFAGAWLDDQCLADSFLDDPLPIRKRIELGEIVLFDPTLATNPSAPASFEFSVGEGARRLREDAFCGVIDVCRARKAQIRPLAEFVARDDASAAPAPARIESAAPAVPKAVAIGPASAPPPAGETRKARVDRWLRKLLDLSLRNRLLNFKETKKTIPLLCPDLGALEDALASGAEFSLLARTKEFAANDPREAALHLRRTERDATASVLAEEMASHRLHASLASEELERRLLEVYRAARVGVEEGGASALYLALGFMTWYETATSERPLRAPLLLLPLELHRRSAREGFSLRLGDDEPRVNVTLLEMLKQDHNIRVDGLEPLPTDDSGLDVDRILRCFREATRDVPRWEVTEHVQIGIFSFAKFLMWRDLAERADSLEKNPIVDHLVNRPHEAFDPGGEFPKAEQLDSDHPATSTYCPLPADSSQLAAVFAAATGKSFVLEGPPGTGKSQTITNLIAHCLAHGQTVLFVSEKMAALDVVHTRLQRAGLGQFCLELHSNKAHKKEVVGQLARCLEPVPVESDDEWRREAQRVESLRGELNQYANALHQPRTSGESAFRAVSRLIGLRDVPRISMLWDSPERIDPDRLRALRDSADRLQNTATVVGDVRSNAWRAVRRTHWTPVFQRETADAIAAARERLAALAVVTSHITEAVHFASAAASWDELAVLDELASLLLRSPAPPVALVVKPDWEEIAALLSGWVSHGRERDELRRKVFARFSERVLRLDAGALLGRLGVADQSIAPLRWWRRRGIAKALQPATKDGSRADDRDLHPLLETIGHLQTEERHLEQSGDHARALLGRFWRDGESDWSEIEQVRDWAAALRALASKASGGSLPKALELREHWSQLSAGAPAALREGGEIGRHLVEFRECLVAARAEHARIETLLDLDALAWGEGSSPAWIPRASSLLIAWEAALPTLRTWLAWRDARNSAAALGLEPLAAACERGELRGGQLRQAFERGYTEWWHEQISESDASLSGFFSPEHQRKISEFRAADERFMLLTKGVIAGKLASRLPQTTTASLPASEVGVLQREMARKRGHVPVRQLFNRIPNLLLRIKPCLLMSPMSVAQYLDSGLPAFDVVVFDEASQIPVWDAIGALGRARQSVVVGDPKQLPPTNFFQRANDDEDERSDETLPETLESILDECIAARVPWLQLNWHYRSRHESLVAFSNYHYYGNRLLTFPSPIREGIGVTLRPVPHGVYDRGNTSTNRAEADALIEEIVRRLRDSERSKHSIGVVTFSQAQQALIENLLEEVRRDDPVIDAFFSEAADEPVFVKNLENVQGDERDVILFSICYGPDRTGQPTMNFGPLNRDGGERRLNVAVTRARREVIVFATLRADQIDLSRTKARGARDLKLFLDYAERGVAAIAAATFADDLAETESPFEEEVFKALASRGWGVHKQVGCARYRIDLAVVDPRAPGRYLLGVECDGANYHRAKTARDRDKLREGVLRDLGWTLHRIWSTDWWLNPGGEIEKLERALAAALERETLVASPPPPAPQTPTTTTEGSRRAPSKSSLVRTQALPPYEAWRGGRQLGSQADFYDARTNVRIGQVASEIIRAEAPISIELLAARIGRQFGFQRTTEGVLDRVRRLVPSTTHIERREGTFLWENANACANHNGFRVAGANEDSHRDIPEIAIQELANGMLYVLRQHLGAPAEALIRETARVFGTLRVGKHVELRLRRALGFLIEGGKAQQTGEGHVSLIEGRAT